MVAAQMELAQASKREEFVRTGTKSKYLTKKFKSCQVMEKNVYEFQDLDTSWFAGRVSWWR